ncbi:MAG: EthD domain-containing protein [Phenylobacterium sp.]|uniref:EthD domain-containing protein n=1 Tax=Phenylobacterium sp. TaxID=1871053 RepID=UPI001A60BDBF|nr:EthD domain-containing protein [Phenylobacterium sp.]MBL8772803.1 EthD domain-containing protein [Phenylobacterium sp.]
MIKLVYVIVRRAELSEEVFRKYWLEQHGPLVAAQAGVLRLRKYVQSHPIDEEASEGMRAVRGMRPRADGLTEVWWDSLEDFQAAYATPEGQAAGRILAEDEAKFIDFEKSAVFLTEEHLIFDHTGGRGPAPGAPKATYLLTRRDGLTQAECHDTWLRDHGPLVASFAGPLRMARYVQSHAIAPEVNAGMQAGRNYEPPLDGITEVWVDPDAQPSATLEEARDAAMALVEDERRFVQMDRSRLFMSREHVIFDHTR